MQAKLTKKQEREFDARIENAYRATCAGVQVNIMDIPKIFAAGRNAILDHADDHELRRFIRGYVDILVSK